MTAGPEGLPPESTTPAPAGGRSAQATVARNTSFLLVAQVLGMPLTLAVNAVMARKLGPDEFGYIYLALTLASFFFLAVEWGQSGSLPRLIVKDRASTGKILGTALAWRVASVIPIYGALVLVSIALGYGRAFQGVLVLVVLARAAGTICGACLDAARGLENTALTAYSSVRYNLLCVGLVIPTLWLGGRLLAVLVALWAADVVNTAFVWRAVRRLGIRGFSVDIKTLRVLLATGTSFMLLNLALALQPNVDAVLLSNFGTPQAMGWFAAARKLIGALVFPVTALQGALYPTLCRLFVEDAAAFKKMVGTALRTSAILVVPIALGTGLYPELGIRIFSEASFAPAENNLRVMAVFLLLVYFTMVLGAAIAASGRQSVWAVAQLGCVAVSAIADPLLIPWFHRTTGNGGLGVCVSSVLSELLMIICGFWVAPRGLFDRPLVLGVGRAIVAGGAMVLVSRQMTSFNPFLGATASVAAYAVCLWLIGGIDKETIETIRATIARRAGRSGRA
jgi:O-antigen/teichoic acid export membrane protein